MHRRGVYDYFIDESLEVVLVVEKNSIFISALPGLDFALFLESNAVPVGIERGVLVSVRGATPIFTPYEKFALNVHLDRDPAECARIAQERFGADGMKQFAAEVLASRGAAAFLAIIRALPDQLYGEILFSVLESSEIRVRKMVIAELGSALTYFCELAAAVVRNADADVPEFVATEAPPKIDLAVAFLQFLAEEVSVAVYLAAALFCLRRSYDTIDRIAALIPHLKPLIGRASAVEIDSVSCEGVIMQVTVYSDLRVRLEAVVGQCVADLLGGALLPEVVVYLCTSTKVPLISILGRLSNIEKKFNIPELIEKLRGRLDMAVGTAVAAEFGRAGWVRWKVAVLAAVGQLEEVRACVDADAGLQDEIAGTPLSQLLGRD
jgi:hypothetical protein